MISFAQWSRWIGVTCMASGALLFACSDDPAEVGTGGSPGTGGDTTTTDATSAPASQAVVTTAATTTSGMSNFDCDPPAEAGSIFELTDVGVFPPNDVFSMCQFRGDVMLVFNAAAI